MLRQQLSDHKCCHADVVRKMFRQYQNSGRHSFRYQEVVSAGPAQTCACIVLDDAAQVVDGVFVYMVNGAPPAGTARDTMLLLSEATRAGYNNIFLQNTSQLIRL